MSLADLASIGSFISGVAVLASLIFVGIQLRQNTKAVRATASQAHSASWVSLVSAISENADLAKIWTQGVSDFDGLTDPDRVRFLAFTTGVFRFCEASRVQWLRGQLDSEHWHTVEAFLRDFATQPGIQRFWKVRKHWHASEFRVWFETLHSSKLAGELYDQRNPVVLSIIQPGPNPSGNLS